MKKTVIALAIASTATSVSALELYKSDEVSVNFYGSLRQQVVLTDKKNTDPKIDAGSTRLGMDVAYIASDDLEVFGKFEFGVGNTKHEANDRDHDLHMRQHYVGVKTDYGLATFGKRGPIADTAFGAEYSYFFGAPLYTFLDRSNFWQNNAVQYEYTRDKTWLKALFNLPENDSAAQLMELYVGSSFDALSLHSGFSLLEDKTNAKDMDKTYFEVTAEYTLSTGMVGFTYTYNKSEDNKANTTTKSDGYHLGGIFDIANKTKAYGGFQYIDSAADVKNLYLGVEYNFARWARAYAEYGFNDTDHKSNENKFAIGARVNW